MPINVVCEAISKTQQCSSASNRKLTTRVDLRYTNHGLWHLEVRVPLVGRKQLATSWFRARKRGLGNVQLIVEEERAQHDICRAQLETGQETERAFARAAPAQAKPALQRSERGAATPAAVEVHLCVWAAVQGPRVVLLPLALEDLLVVGTVRWILPSLDGTGVQMSLQAVLSIT